jgi:glutathione S-transferase
LPATIGHVLELAALPYSPWSEKARWALDHHGVAYEESRYQPILGEPWMRVRQRKMTGPVSVPVLLGAGQRCGDSWSIALYADRVGKGSPLIPEGDSRAIQEVDELSERGMSAARALALDRVLRSSAALNEMLPKPLRRRLGAAGTAIAAFGIRRTLRKYGAHALALSDHEAQLVAVLDTMRARIAAVPSAGSDPQYWLGRFSYADIAAAQVLLFVSPVSASFRSVRIGKASRAAFEHPVLAEAYRDVLAWRDRLYARHR